MKITEDQFIKLMSILTDAKKGNNSHIFSLNSVEINNLYNDIIRLNSDTKIEAYNLNNLPKHTLEEKIVLAKNLGVTFKYCTNLEERNKAEKNTCDSLMSKFLPPQIILSSWVPLGDKGFEKMLDEILTITQQQNYIGLLRKHRLI